MKIAVIGEGLAGLTAALMAHERGHKVTIFTKGMGSLGLSQGTADVLGYLTDNPQPIPGDPFESMSKLPADHPFHTIGVDHVRAGIEWYRENLPGFWAAPSPDGANTLLPTALGAARPTYLVPQSCAAGALHDGMKLLVVGLEQFKDFPASLIADNLNRSPLFQLHARSVTFDLSGRGNEADVSATDYARAFDVAEFDPQHAAKMREKFATMINREVKDDETVLIPALMGLDAQSFNDFAAQVQVPVAEVPTIPPSVLGRRIFDKLVQRCRDSRVDIRLNCAVTGFNSLDGRVTSLRVARAGGTDEVPVDAVLDAGGGLMSGNLERDSYLNLHETIFDLPVFTPPVAQISSIHEIDRENREEVESILRSGIKVNSSMQPLDEKGDVVLPNVLCLGEMLYGGSPWRELSGEGLAVGSAYAAVQALDKMEKE